MITVEKRKFPRLPFNVNVKWEILDAHPLSVEEVQANNISAGGICLVILEKVNIGTLLKLKFSLPHEVSSIVIKGRVIWIKEFSVSHTSYDKAYDCGIEFIDLGPQDQKNLSRYL